MAQPNDTAAGRYLDGATLDKIKRLDVRARVVVEVFMSGCRSRVDHGFAGD